jgi:small subunit ribosomal protein S13
MTIRVSGVILPPNKHIRVALRSIYGVGNFRALAICAKVGLNPATKVNELKEEYAPLLQEAVNQFEVEGDLRRRIAMDIKRLVDIKCYRGLRHKRGLPVRGQRTKTNARTRKGRKRQASSGMGAMKA